MNLIRYDFISMNLPEHFAVYYYVKWNTQNGKHRAVHFALNSLMLIGKVEDKSSVTHRRRLHLFKFYIGAYYS